MRVEHIYLEKEAQEYEFSKSILKRFPDAGIILVDDYKSVFNRPRQDFQVQKTSTKLILAQKKDHFLYKGSYLSNSYGHEHFFYNSLILNCIYNCAYCYLQGMYKSSYIVIFVNLEDFFKETDKHLAEYPVFLCISYDTDLLALERYIPYTSEWIRFARTRPNLLLEIRTKSSNFKQISGIEPIENVIMAWTLSPQEVIRNIEKRTPSLKKRLESIRQAVETGWKVRLCFDPVIYVPDWKKIYSEMIIETLSTLPSDKLVDVSLGVFRVNSEYLRNMKEVNSSKILFFPFEKREGFSSYPQELQDTMMNYLKEIVLRFIPPEKLCM
ncbi:MAG: hypothetical protein H7A25_03500 [Leptospiraceae bacterium]|nr:DNA photolyase [Leptospiraceae bacterium]MCP5498942.1 hypothetical protein [Leptospiraceae bacterium]